MGLFSLICVYLLVQGVVCSYNPPSEVKLGVVMPFSVRILIENWVIKASVPSASKEGIWDQFIYIYDDDEIESVYIFF